MKQLLLAAWSIVFFACTNKDSFTQEQKEKVKQQVATMFDQYYKDMKNKGLMSEFSYLDHSEDFFWVPSNFHSPLTYDSVKTIITANAQATQYVDFRWQSLTIYPLTPSVATYAGVVTGIVIDTAQIENHVKLLESGTVIKRKDGWKLLSGQSRVLNAN